MMLRRLAVWGVVFAAGGAVLWGKHSYDTTGMSLLMGAFGGLLIGLAVGWAIHSLHHKRKRN